MAWLSDFGKILMGWFHSVGKFTIELFSGFSKSLDVFYQTLPVIGMGMLGIFVVTAVIVLVIYLLNKIFK